MGPGQQVFNEFLQEPGLIPQRFKGPNGFICRIFCHLAGIFQGKDGDIRRFIVFKVAADGLSKQGFVADDIEDIVGDLEGQAHVGGVFIEGLSDGRLGIGNDGCHIDGRFEDDACLRTMEKFHPFPADVHRTV